MGTSIKRMGPFTPLNSGCVSTLTDSVGQKLCSEQLVGVALRWLQTSTLVSWSSEVMMRWSEGERKQIPSGLCPVSWPRIISHNDNNFLVFKSLIFFRKVFSWLILLLDNLTMTRICSFSEFYQLLPFWLVPLPGSWQGGFVMYPLSLTRAICVPIELEVPIGSQREL